MFLALREIRHSPARFVLITFVVFLVSYLVYFLTGLAYGLASSYTEAIEDWDAKSIVLTKDANVNASGSRITEEAADAVVDAADEAALLSITPTAVSVVEDGEDTRENAFIFAVDPTGPLAPVLKEGEEANAEHEIVVDNEIARYGYGVGDTLTLPDSDVEWKITGVAERARYQALPTIFMDRDAYAEEFTVPQMNVKANAIVLPKSDGSDIKTVLDDNDLEAVSIDKFIDELPGYTAQVLTFTLMIGSLIAILVLVLGIFLYVMTIQKKQIFGVMKAQGIPTSYILISGAMQTFVLTVVGVALGLIATLITGFALEGTVPFRVQPWFFVGVTAAFIIFTLIGGLIPVRTISRIDPIEAID